MRKIYEKNTKLLAKLLRDVKQRVLIVKGGKVDFSFLIIRSNRGC